MSVKKISLSFIGMDCVSCAVAIEKNMSSLTYCVIKSYNVQYCPKSCVAFGYNIVLIPVAMGILYPWFEITINPMFAGAAMVFSSLSVVLNAL